MVSVRSSAAESLFLGRDAGRSIRLCVAAGGLFLAVFALHAPPRLVGGLSFPFGLFLPAPFGVPLLAAAVGAYLNDGLLVSVALAGGPSLGFYLPLALFELTTPHGTVAETLGVGTVFAVVLGVAGFLVGAIARCAVRRFRDGTET